jgi:hypothetical protein
MRRPAALLNGCGGRCGACAAAAPPAQRKVAVDLGQALDLRTRHTPRPARRWRPSRPRCRTCRERWPCAPHRMARARILHLVREAFAGALR